MDQIQLLDEFCNYCRKKKGLLQNILSCFYLDGKSKKSLEGIIYGNPALQSGG